MSVYGLIKATSRIMRSDTIADLHILNQWRYAKGLNGVSPISPSVRQLENCVALGMEGIDCSMEPELVRSKDFYLSLLKEITEKERKKWNTINSIRI